jgi:hypothetical protein
MSIHDEEIAQLHDHIAKLERVLKKFLIVTPLERSAVLQQASTAGLKIDNLANADCEQLSDINISESGVFDYRVRSVGEASAFVTGYFLGWAHGVREGDD